MESLPAQYVTGGVSFRKRTREERLNGSDLWLASAVRRAAPVVLRDYQKLYQAETLSSWTHGSKSREKRMIPPLFPLKSKGKQCTQLGLGATSHTSEWVSIKPKTRV